MAEPSEINRAVKQGLDVLVSGDGAEAYMQPITGAEDLIAKGLMDANGNATSKGVLFTDLQSSGMLDDEGKLSEKGWAYAMPYEDVLKDGFSGEGEAKTYDPKQNNLWAYKVRHEDGIDDTDLSFGDMAGGVGEMLWDAGAGLAMNIGYMGNPTFGPEIERKRALAGAATMEGTINATEELVQMGAIGSALVGSQIGGLIGMEKEADDALWSARQTQDRVRHENMSAKVGETLEQFEAFAGAADSMAKVYSELPKEEADKIVKQGGALGQFADPTILLPAGAAAKVGKVGIVTRAALKAESVLAKTAAMDSRLASTAVRIAEATRAATIADATAQTAGRLSDEIAARFEQTGDQLLARRSVQAQEIAGRATREAAKATDEVASLSEEAAGIAAVRNRALTLIPEQAALATKKAVDIGRAAKSVPVTAISRAAEAIGDGLILADDQLRAMSRYLGVDKAWQITKLGAGAAGFGMGLPVIPGAVAVLNSGPILSGLGKFGRVVGKEMSKARGQVPFWQRVANYSDLSPAHRALARFADTATMGGAVPGAISRTARGVAVAYPIDLAFNYLAEGGELNANTLKQAFAESLVIGGSSAMLGGMFQGTKSRHRELALGDELEFRRNVDDPVQKEIYSALPPGTRRAVATYAAANPQLQFNFVESGPSSFDGNVATINLRSNNPLKPLIAHEVMHNVVIRNQMEEGIAALLIGDGEAGGLLRSNDGKLDPNFKEFWDAYNQRVKTQGQPEIGVKQAALEYYIDSAADHVAGIAETGELGSLSGRTDVRRKVIQPVIDATLSRIPIIRDLHFKMGGLLDSEGRMVMGNGLLADGIRELPQAREMTRRMLRNSSGRSQGGFDPMGRGRGLDDSGGATLTVPDRNSPVIDKLISIFETDEINGKTVVRRDSNGDPVPISKGTNDARSNISLVVGEAIDKQNQAGVPPKPGEITKDPATGDFDGNHLGPLSIKEISDRNILNKEQLRILKNLNSAVKDFDGSRFSVIYHPATKKVGKKVRYATLAPTLRDVVPVAVIPTKQGNLNIGLMSVTQLEANIADRTASKRGKSLYSGNREQVMTDVAEVMEMHRQDVRTDSYFENKYGATKGPEYKNFINTIFGVMTPSQRDINPLFEADKINEKQNVYKTYRVDRISQATRLDPNVKVPMPFIYNSVKLNLMPNGLPTLDAAGNPVAVPTP